jgi:hypothetical protein
MATAGEAKRSKLKNKPVGKAVMPLHHHESDAHLSHPFVPSTDSDRILQLPYQIEGQESHNLGNGQPYSSLRHYHDLSYVLSEGLLLRHYHGLA